jgi:hypothetical protein
VKERFLSVDVPIDREKRTTHIHLQHVGQAVIQILLLCERRELVGDGVLTLPSDKFCMFLRIKTMGNIVRFHKERIARLVAGGGTLVECHGDGCFSDG